MAFDINRYQLISTNRLILIIDDQSMANFCVVIDFQYQSIDKLVQIGCRLMERELTHKKTLQAVIVNTFHFKVNSRRILSSFSLTLTPCLQQSAFLTNYVSSICQPIDFKKRKVDASCFHKNSGKRSCSFANNEIANNSSMSCCKIMNKAAIPTTSNNEPNCALNKDHMHTN